jgi:hypothetical protein
MEILLLAIVDYLHEEMHIPKYTLMNAILSYVVADLRGFFCCYYHLGEYII